MFNAKVFIKNNSIFKHSVIEIDAIVSASPIKRSKYFNVDIFGCRYIFVVSILKIFACRKRTYPTERKMNE